MLVESQIVNKMLYLMKLGILRERTMFPWKREGLQTEAEIHQENTSDSIPPLHTTAGQTWLTLGIQTVYQSGQDKWILSVEKAQWSTECSLWEKEKALANLRLASSGLSCYNPVWNVLVFQPGKPGSVEMVLCPVFPSQQTVIIVHLRVHSRIHQMNLLRKKNF